MLADCSPEVETLVLGNEDEVTASKKNPVADHSVEVETLTTVDEGKVVASKMQHLLLSTVNQNGCIRLLFSLIMRKMIVLG